MSMLTRIGSCLGLGFTSGCVTPNLLGETSDSVYTARDFGPGAEAVEIAVGDGESLRGVFVSAGANAPLVLHFLGAGETWTAPAEVAGKMVWVGDTTRELAALGLSSLVVNYRGIGGSDGERHSEQTPGDARAMWAEAVRRADGLADRVIVRAMSFGTLAAAGLFQAGIEPRAVVLIAPIRAETVAVRWTRARRNWFLAALGWVILRDALEVNQEAAIAAIRAPLLTFFATRDELLSEAEQAALQDAARSAGATLVFRDQVHLELTRDARSLLPGEAQFYGVVTGQR